MDKGKLEAKITSSFKTLQLDSAPKILLPSSSYRPPLERARCRSLLSLCIGVLGKHFEDITAELNEIAVNFPPDIKMAMLGVARRRNLLNDDVLIALAEKSWDILDISGSEVSDFGLVKVAELCHHLRAIDISGCARSDLIARRCLSIFKPKLNHMEGESWEELDSMDISNGVQSMRWLVWPTIDDHSKDMLAAESPRIVVNPKPSPFGFRGVDVPREAFPGVAMDDPVVKDIDPGTWAARRRPKIAVATLSDASELPRAERFRLAFVERDSRLAPKRAKNARQHQRRADREWVMRNTEAKSIALASQASKSLYDRR
eukprot:TRINITY_DN5955_c0_g2_i4.p1 TRINITY_DN5955_c0_g2~~TRINITY_DN5955_c0_g2_i4.p1  ORF type:complete len:317 (-),score=72.61 TRINITY_DN5955_c0_g2_i4:131-1081(-)